MVQKSNSITAETDSDKAHTLADFFSSVYTVKDNGDFEYLPMRVTDNQMKMSDVILNCDMIIEAWSQACKVKD